MSKTLSTRSRIKNMLLERQETCARGGHPVLANICAAPVLLVRRARTFVDSMHRAIAQKRMKIRGEWVPFLQPYWKEEELAIARLGAGNANTAALKTLEGRFLESCPSHSVAVATSSGRTALRIALRALSAKNPARREVILPAYAGLSLLQAVLQSELVPVFADVEQETLLASSETCAPLIGPRTLAVLVVHLGGRRMESVSALASHAQDTGAAFIEDLCQATGMPPDAKADFTIHSFGIGKILYASAGGMLTARQTTPALEEEIRRLQAEKPDHVIARLRYMRRIFLPSLRQKILAAPAKPDAPFQSAYEQNRMAPIDALLVLRQWDRLREILALRARNASIIADAIRDVPGIRLAGIAQPNLWCKCTAIAGSEVLSRTIQACLRAAGIETEALYTPLHLLSEGSAWAREPLPVSEEIHKRAFCLPVQPNLPPRTMERIAHTLREALAKG